MAQAHATAAHTTSMNADDDAINPIYSLKRIKFFQRDVPIVCQNENGPCPLLAIVNILSLRNQIKLPAGAEHIDQVVDGPVDVIAHVAHTPHSARSASSPWWQTFL